MSTNRFTDTADAGQASVEDIASPKKNQRADAEVRLYLEEKLRSKLSY